MVMLCESITFEEFKQRADLSEWIVERKYDGIRAYIKHGKIYNRHDKEITKLFPEFMNDLKSLPVHIAFDAEIVAQSHEFNDISGRIHFKDAFLISLASKKSPAKLMIFDYYDNIAGNMWSERRDVLESIKLPVNCELSQAIEGANIEQYWADIVVKYSWEGLVAKRKTSKYVWGKRSQDWLKIKAFKETEHKFTKYEVHPRGVTIEDDEGRRVVVNGAQAKEVVDTFKKTGCAIAQVQYLPQRNGTWRFPSFRGLK